MSNHQFIVWHDTLGGEANMVECLSYEGKESVVNHPPLGAGDFVVIEDSDQKTEWMAQVVEPQRNLPLQGLSRDSPSEVAVFERILQGDIEKSIFLNQVYYYRLQLIGEVVTSGRLKSVRRRPRAGSMGRVASEEAVRKALDLPAVEDYGNGRNNIVGRIHSTEIPVAVDWSALKQHILVAGATGSGKSNTVANVIKAAQGHGACVIIYDQKPDYQNIDNNNDETHIFENWRSQPISIFGLDDVNKYCLYQGEFEKKDYEEAITIRARDVDRNMLVNALFPYPDEGNQRDTFGSLLDYYAEQNTNWTLNEFSVWLQDNKSTKQLTAIAEERGWGPFNTNNLQTTQRKMSLRKMRWLDSLETTTGKTQGGIYGNTSSISSKGYFQPLKKLEAGKIIVIRTNASGREYGLFLSYILREVYDLKRDGKINFPIVNIVDEAQDIFQSESAIRNTVASTMNEIIRKGRSKDIGFVIAVQSSSQVPESVLTNMNTRFIHRQNSIEELHKAIPSASKELMASSLSFGAGEALVSIIGARSVVHAEMAPSPFELTKTSAAPRQTLGDQVDETLTQDTDDIGF